MTAPGVHCRLIDRLMAPADDLLELLVHKSSFGIVIVDCAGCVVRANGALRRIVLASCSLLAGSAVLDIFALPRRSEAWDELRPVLLGLRPQITFISMVPGKDGGLEHTVDVTVVGLREADGSISGAILHLSDISVQTRLEAQLAHGQKLQAVGQFTSAVAHDFNNLLMAICGAADEVLLRGSLDLESEADLLQIRSSGERGASLVRHLLAFGKPQPQQSQALNVNDVVVALSRLLLRVLGSGINLDVVIADGQPRVWADPVTLDQMLVNLVVNARNAMPAGGTVTLTTGMITIAEDVDWEGTLAPPGRYVSISVGDTGVGIAADVLPHIFNPFFTTRGDQGGSGLGLSNVSSIVRHCHGFVTVASELGHGATLCIYLPCYEDRSAGGTEGPRRGTVDAAKIPEGRRVAAGPTILLVEDDDAVRALTMRVLVAQGWRVVSTESTEAAMALLTEDVQLTDALCLIISDVTLPGQDGVALVQAVRGIRPGLPAILVSGYSNRSVADDPCEDIHYLTKPYTFAAIAAAAKLHALQARASHPTMMA